MVEAYVDKTQLAVRGCAEGHAALSALFSVPGLES